MTSKTLCLDLRSCPPGMPAHTYAFYALRDLEPGAEVVLISAEDPALLLKQLQLQLRNRLSWRCVREQKVWRVSIRRREDTEASTLQDILSLDHERLDALLVRALAQLRARGSSAAVPEVMEFLHELRRHIDVENSLLAPAFPSLYGPEENNPVATMLREHEDIVKQTIIIEELFHQAGPDPTEAEIWFGLLAAALSKHEHREETRLFPLWDALLRQNPDADTLIQQVRAGINPRASRAPVTET
ncbi:MAG: hemerythrin domain-containing protein [Acidiferrobacterales bacterium]